MTVRLHTLGSLELRAADGSEIRSVLAQPKRLAVLVFLAASGARLHRRDRLVAMFWPEADAESARASLRTALSVLRRSLGEGAVVTRGNEEVGIARELLRCDVADFEEACAAGDHPRALALYGGDLLPGFHLDEVPEWDCWLEERRATLRRAAAAAARALAEEAENSGDPAAAAAYARTAAALAPDDEGTLRRLLGLLDRVGDRAGALHAFEDFARRLRDALGADPSPETESLVHAIRIRAASEGGTPPTPDHHREVPTSVPALDPGTPGPAEDGTRAGGAGPTPTTLHAGGLSGPRRRRLRAAAVAGVLAASAAVLAHTSRTVVSDPASAPAAAGVVASIAVLPFADMSAGGDQQYLADGTAEEILNALTRVEGLRVVARTSTFAYRGRDTDIRELGRSLRVEAVLEGSVRREGERVRITAQLIDARSGYHLWSETYDRAARDIFAIQDEIAGAIVTRLAGRFGGTAPRRAVPTEDPAAYDHYLRGIHFLKRGARDDLHKAVAEFEAAIARDPGFAAAHAGLVDTYIQLPTLGILPPAEAFALARPAAQRAVELAPELAIAHAALARVRYEGDWNLSAAAASYDRALQLDPAHELHFRYPFFLAAVGRLPEAIAVIRRTVALDPLAVAPNARLGLLLYFDRQHGAAVEVLRRTVELEPTYFYSRWYLGLAYIQTGRLAEAIGELEAATKLSGDSPLVRATLGCAYARAGRLEEARRIRDDLIAGAGLLYLRPQGLIFLLSELGETEEAFRRLEASVADRSMLPYVLAREPLLDGLRGDPRFPGLLRRAGLR